MIIETKAGKLQGFSTETYHAFLGIPYAAPPVGELRWKEPQPVEPWDGVRDATKFSAISMQPAGQAIPGNDPCEGNHELVQSEDCLYLNVWTPDVDPKEKMPVFFWIHGGANCCGSGNGDNARPEPFVSRGIIFVTMNYRLGLLGYFAHPDLSAESEHGVSGNYTHFDQIAALNWVIENIEAFGGDPKRITVGGCSAGAIGTQALINSPLTEGKIAGAIVESGIGMDPTSYPESFKEDTLDKIEAGGVELMEKLGVTTIAELRALPYEKLVSVPESNFRRKLHFATTLGTCGDGYFLPIPSNECTMTLRNHNIPYLIGTTADEAGGFAMFSDKETILAQTHDLFTTAIDPLLEAYDLDKKEGLMAAMHDMHTGHCAAKAFAQLQASHGRSPVYVFSFTHGNPETGKANHGLETKYLLNNLDRFEHATPLDQTIADNMQEYWCNFIKYGNPNGQDNAAVSASNPLWKPYDGESRTVLLIGDTMTADTENENPLQEYVRTYAVNVCEKRIADEQN